MGWTAEGTPASGSIGARSSFEPHRGEIQAGGSSFGSQSANRRQALRELPRPDLKTLRITVTSSPHSQAGTSGMADCLEPPVFWDIRRTHIRRSARVRPDRLSALTTRSRCQIMCVTTLAVAGRSSAVLEWRARRLEHRCRAPVHPSADRRAAHGPARRSQHRSSAEDFTTSSCLGTNSSHDSSSPRGAGRVQPHGRPRMRVLGHRYGAGAGPIAHRKPSRTIARPRR